MSNEKINTKMMVKGARLSYANIWEAKGIKAADGSVSDPKFSTALLISKTTKEGKAMIAQINVILEALKKQGIEKWGKWPKNAKWPLHDGDTDLDKEDANYAGQMYMNANNKNRPQIVDQNVTAILDKTKVYSGCYANVMVNFFLFDNVSKGIGCSLGNIQFVKDGEPFGSATRAEDDFEAVEVPEDEDDDLIG